ncbi:O-antigen ligase family protein, partial [bacterium]|nr:O-antigen ligase family protein [candidate division CSSED10-310 bacterium]
MVMICDRLIEVGLILILIYTPLAFGAVTEYSTMLFEMAIGGLLLVWLIKMFSQRKKAPRDGSWQPGKHYLRFVNPPVFIPLCVFFIFLIFQRILLPGSLVKIISPNTYHLYAEAARITSVTIPPWLPLSVCAQSTETEFLKFLTYVAVFFIIINNIRRPEQVKRLVYAIIAVGFSESLYGLLQLLSGKQFLSFYPKAFLISGSFINKNHFAGYMEMVILLTFGVIFTRFEKPRSSHQGDSEPIEEKYAKTSLSLFLVLIMISAHLLSGSRGGIISLAGGIIFFAILVNIRHLLRQWIIVLLIFLPLVLVLMVMMVPDQISRNFSRFTGEQFDLSFQTRWEIWRTQGHIFQDFPAVGSGFGT